MLFLLPTAARSAIISHQPSAISRSMLSIAHRSGVREADYSSTVRTVLHTAATGGEPVPYDPTRHKAIEQPAAMGKRSRGRKNKGQDAWNGSQKAVVRSNSRMEAFYREQSIVPTDEWDSFWAALRDSLPATFRIQRGRYAAATRATLESAKDGFGLGGNQGQEHTIADSEGKVWKVEPPSPVEWLPPGYAWNVNIPRPLIRKDPKLKTLHEWLIVQNNAGNINRQEAVSMIPPMLLDVRPGQRVLDMCAAPGSKTAQILDFLHAGPGGASGRNAGLCVANDSDSKRAFMLTHQLLRFGGDATVVTNHEAQRFPKLRSRLPKRPEEDESTRDPSCSLSALPPPEASVSTTRDEGFQFQRILADVPCSGDGTMRKCPEMWRKWNYGMGLGLHKLQIAILLRGVELLEAGGRLVYSTCSLNPYENESVVAEAIRRFGGKLEVVDVSSELPRLRRSPGLLTWKVRGSGDTDDWYMSVEDVPKESGGKYPPTLWPPPSDEEARALGLQHCMRLLPHYHNTGAFFVAVLRKTAPTIPGHDYALGREDEPDKQAALPSGPGNHVPRAEWDALLKRGLALVAAGDSAAPCPLPGHCHSVGECRQLQRSQPSAAAAAATVGSMAGVDAAPSKAGATATTKPPALALATSQAAEQHEAAVLEQKRKRGVCFDFLKGKCTREKCSFAHERAAADGTIPTSLPPAKRIKGESAASVAARLAGARGKKRTKENPQDRLRLIPADAWQTNPALKSCATFYGFRTTGPSAAQHAFPVDCTLQRGDGTASKIFLISEDVKALFAADSAKQLRLIAAGTKILQQARQAKQASAEQPSGDQQPCNYRLCQDSIAVVWPLLGPERMVRVDAVDLATLVAHKVAARATTIVQPATSTGRPTETIARRDGAEVVPVAFCTPGASETVLALSPGSCVLQCMPASGANGESSSQEAMAMDSAEVEPVSAVCWKGNTPGSLSLFVTKEELTLMQTTSVLSIDPRQAHKHTTS